MFLRYSGNTLTGKRTPESAEATRLIRKLIGSPCLKYKTKEAAINPKPKKLNKVNILKIITIRELNADNWKS